MSALAECLELDEKEDKEETKENKPPDQVFSYSTEVGYATKSRPSDKFKQPALHYVAEKAGMTNIDKDKI